MKHSLGTDIFQLCPFSICQADMGLHVWILDAGLYTMFYLGPMLAM